MKIRQRFLAMFVAAALLPVLGAGGVAFFVVKHFTYDRAASQLDAFAAIQESRLDRILEENQERISGLTTRGDIRRLMAQVTVAEDDTQRELLRSQLNGILTDALYANDAFRQVELVDASGRIFASTLSWRINADVGADEVVVAGRTGPTVTTLYLDSSGQERFRLGGPVFSEGRFVGTALIETDTLNLLSVASDFRALGRTGETLIARPLPNGNAEIVVPLRSDPDAALHRVIASGSDRPPIIEALARREESFRDVLDYRGTRVFAATRFVDRAGFGISVKMDTDEVDEPLAPLRRLLLETLIGSLLVAIALAAYAAHKLTAPIVRLTATARRIAEGSEETRVEAVGDDETADLGKSFNLMVDKLLAERQRLEAAVKSLPVGVVVVGQDDQIMLRNDHAAHILGISARTPYGLEEIVGAFPPSLRLQSKFRECVKKGKVIEMKEEYIGERAVRLLLSPVRAGGADGRGFVLLLEDISESRRLERAKSDFVSVASHQLRTPLTAIKGIISMLLDRDLGPLTTQQAPFIEEMQHSTDRMIALVNALLNTSRIDLGIFSVEPEAVDMAEMAQSVVEEMAILLQKKKMRLNMDIDPQLGPAMVDPKLMRMIFQNLLSNAVKYTGVGGSIDFEVQRKGGRINIRVADTGYGIPEKQRDKIFTKMFRADNARQLDPDGTGLGLYIVKAIVEATGGEIHFTSTEGKGTTFDVSLPRDGMRPKQGSKVLEDT